jgi:hypothetical protein
LRRPLLAGIAVLVGLTGACRSGADAPPPRTTTTSTSTSTTTTTTLGLAPNGCDPAALSRAKPRPDRTRYVVDATVDLANNSVTGTLRARFTPDKGTDQIVLRLWPNGPTTARHGAHEEIANASVDGRTVAFHMTNPTTAFVDSGNLEPNKAVDVNVSFTLRLPASSDDRLSRSGATVRLGSWLPLLSWEPGVGWDLDPPTTSNAEASVTVASDFDVHFVTPAGLNVLATGVDNGGGHWTASAVGDWAASVGDFSLATGKAGDTPVTVAVDRALRESPQTYLDRVVRAIDDMSTRFGPYPYPAFTLAITPGLKGGIEYPGHVMQGPNTNARTTPHEVAHQWFYSLVGNDQGRDPWLDEGLASWAEAVINNSYASFIAKEIPAAGRGRLGEAMPYWDARSTDYYRSVYVQTVQALGALGVSQAAVNCGLARYVAAHAFRVAIPSDLVGALQTVAPNAKEVLERFGAQRLDPPVG